MYRVAFGLLSLFPAEPIHHVVFGGLRAVMRVPGLRRAASALLGPREPSLKVSVFGLELDGPLGLAAGFDKNGLGPRDLLALGFSFIEVGSVTPEPQPGNPAPRLFRLKADRALLNRMGFNNDGARAVAARLAKKPDPRVAVNLGKNKTTPEERAHEDYRASARALAPHAAFAVVNVSSPNTKGLRDLQAPEALARILRAAREGLDEGSPSRRVPLLVKIAPDLEGREIDALADLAVDMALDGIVATNTTVSREGLRSPHEALGAGGISGAPLTARALQVLVRVRRRLVERRRADLPIISVGGIASVEDAWARITHGATLLELYTAFIYEGPLVARDIHRGIAVKLAEHGHRSIHDAIGTAVPSRERGIRSAEEEAP